MVLDLASLRAYLYKPFAVKLNDLLSRMMLLGKRYISVSAKDQHWRSAGQAVTDDYDIIRIVPVCELLESTEFAIFHGAMRIALRFTYSLRKKSASAIPVSTSASDVARFVYA